MGLYPKLTDAPVASDPVVIDYTNYRGEQSRRIISAKRLWRGSNQWHPEEQYFLTAYDHDKNEDREFAVKDIKPVSGLTVEFTDDGGVTICFSDKSCQRQ